MQFMILSTFWTTVGWVARFDSGSGFESASFLFIAQFTKSFRCCVLSECCICMCKTVGCVIASPFATNLAKLT